MSTHGTLHDEFKGQKGEKHGGAEFDEGFRPAEGSDPRNEQTSHRPRVSKHGERWDEFGWEAMPARHGAHFDEDFTTPAAMDGKHGTWFDVFRGGTQVRAIVGGKDIEATVLNVHSDHAVAEAKNGDRVELALGQITNFRNVPGSRATPDRQEAERPGAGPGQDAARSGDRTTEHGSGPLPAAPSHGPSSTAGGGHLRKADDEVLDVLKQLVSEDSPSDPFDLAVHKAAEDAVAKAHADTYGEAHAQALVHTQAAVKAAKAGKHDEAWTHHDRAMSWHAKAHMMKTAQNVAAQRSLVGKTVDTSETAVQGQDLETKKPTSVVGKTWCSHCKHFCRHTDDGKCPTCGTTQSTRKDAGTDADVLKSLTDLAQEG